MTATRPDQALLQIGMQVGYELPDFLIVSADDQPVNAG